MRKKRERMLKKILRENAEKERENAEKDIERKCRKSY
jgi:hypothetical protein